MPTLRRYAVLAHSPTDVPSAPPCAPAVGILNINGFFDKARGWGLDGMQQL